MKHFRLWAVCLALTPLAACPAPAPAQAPAAAPSPAAPTLTGPVTKISIVGLKNVSQATVQANLALKVGDAYTPEAAQKDVDALKGIGVFNAVTASKSVDPAGGVSMTYTVLENPLVQSIKFTANTPSGQPTIPAAELMAQMKTRTGEVLNTNVLVKDLDGLFNHTSTTAGYVIKQGYIFDVSSDINIDPKTGVLTIPLVEGHIKSIEVTGNSRIKTANILAQIHTKVGDIFNSDALLQDASTLYETGQLRTVNCNWNTTKPGDFDLTLSVVEQPVGTGSLDEKQGKVIPLRYDPSSYPYPIVQVSVNGHSPQPFILDTGTTAALTLDPKSAKNLGLTVSGKPETENGFVFTRASIDSAILQGQDQSNGIPIGTKEAIVLDLSLFNQINPHVQVTGIIGLGALLQVTARFDFNAKTLTIFSAPHPPLLVSGGTVLPLREASNGNITVRATLAPGTYADLIVDTGSNNTQVPFSALSVLHPTAVAYSSYSQRIDGVFASPNVRLPSLMLGTLRVLNIEAGTLPPQTRLSLGMDILADYRLTLDVPNGQLILEPAASRERYPRGRSGLATKPSGQGWLVSEFGDISPARAAGLRVGDQLVTVAGTSVQNLSDAQVGKLFAVRLGTPLQVVVRREGKETPISWVPVDDLAALPTAIDGLPMQKTPGGPWVICGVMSGYPNNKAGLQAGDTLTQIDGEATATMSLDRFAELVKKPSVQVEVERPGVAQPFKVRLTAPK